ncbi:MAG: hypothetical protein LBQ57_06430 [Spirochaetales bacterium]|jgi:hypothetical protein|nr:hypothetical protein [Spirochaetales bacterium]
MFQKKRRGADINDIAAFFRELVSRSGEFLGRPVRVHFIADAAQCRAGSSDAGDFLPFLRMVLFDAAQNTAANPDTSLHVHTADGGVAGAAGEITAAIAGKSGDDMNNDEFFIITWGKAGMQKNLVKEFSGLPEAARKRLTLFHLPLGMGNTRTEMNALAAAVRTLLKGKRIAAGEAGLRIVQGKI